MIIYEKEFLIRYLDKEELDYKMISFIPNRFNEENEIREKIRFMKQEGHLVLSVFQKMDSKWVKFIK